VAAGQTIVVTGASSGIGRELAIQMAGPGREMWLVGRDAGRLDEVAGIVREKGGDPHIVRMDLADIKSAAAFLTETFPPDKQVDEVYLSAAITMFGEVKDILPEDMVRVKAGKIIIISSLAAYGGYPTAVAYATMKAGLLGLFRSLLHEGRAYGVGVHLAAPGYVDTSIYKTAVFRNTSYEKIMVQIRSLGFRVITAESAARTILARVARGEAQFALPAYASVMKWTAPRFPVIIDLIHGKMVRSFRQAS
jgi:short-subunit dehydrogenase